MHCLVGKLVSEKESKTDRDSVRMVQISEGVYRFCLGRYVLTDKVLACRCITTRMSGVPDFLSFGVALVLTFPSGRHIPAPGYRITPDSFKKKGKITRVVRAADDKMVRL